jgi:hypothetical protein
MANRLSFPPPSNFGTAGNPGNPPPHGNVGNPPVPGPRNFYSLDGLPPLKPISDDFRPAGIHDLRVQNLISEDEAGQLSQCTQFQQNILLSERGVERLRAGCSVHFGMLKTMNADKQRVLCQVNGGDVDLATLCTMPSSAVYPFSNNFPR